MATTIPSRRIEFKTVDGVTLRGDYYSVDTNGAPIVVMTQGLTLLKEHHLQNWAFRFQQAGYAVLAYDHRGWGSSDGGSAGNEHLRNEVNPLRQAEDYHDAVIFASTLPGVDGKRICIWGIGHSGGASTIAAADDANVKAVILMMPWLSGRRDAAGFPPGAMEEMWKERRALCLGSSSSQDLKFIQVWDKDRDEAEGERGNILIHGSMPYEFSAVLRKLSDAAGTPWENTLSLRSLYCIQRSEPKDYMRRIHVPCLHLAASEDVLTGTLEEHKVAFQTGNEPHEFVQLPSHHIDNYFDEAFEEGMKAQIAFLKKHL
jgi:uncharacterized protein